MVDNAANTTNHVAASPRRPESRYKSPRSLLRRAFGGLLPLINDWRFFAFDKRVELRLLIVLALLGDRESKLCGLGEMESLDVPP
jgi:hypothetical protein